MGEYVRSFAAIKGIRNKLIFSIIPRTGTSTFWGIILRPFFASISERSGCRNDHSACHWNPLGHDYCVISAQWRHRLLAISCGPQSTSPIICSNAPITIGPRQIIAVSCGTKKPIDIHVTPCASMGIIVLPSGEDGRPVIPSRVGREGP